MLTILYWPHVSYPRRSRLMGKSNHLRPIYLTAISCMHLLNVLMQQKKKFTPRLMTKNWTHIKHHIFEQSMNFGLYTLVNVVLCTKRHAVCLPNKFHQILKEKQIQKCVAETHYPHPHSHVPGLIVCQRPGWWLWNIVLHILWNLCGLKLWHSRDYLSNSFQRQDMDTSSVQFDIS